MATTNRKRSTSAKSDAKTTETQAEQSAVEESKSTPEAGESPATPAAAVVSAAEPGDTPDSGPIETVTGETTSQDGETVTGDGSGEALPPLDPNAGERTAQGTSGDETASTASDEQAEIPALFVRTRKTILKRRRCGHVFTPEGHGIALTALSADQIHALESDPTLIVEACTLPAQSADNGEDAQ